MSGVRRRGCEEDKRREKKALQSIKDKNANIDFPTIQDRSNLTTMRSPTRSTLWN